MYSMQDPTGKAEQSAYQSQGEATEDDRPSIWPIVISVVSSMAGAYVLRKAMTSTEEGIQLELLHTLVKVLQALARVFGAWALAAEQSYNELAQSLH